MITSSLYAVQKSHADIRWQLTDRDIDILRWVCRHGLVTGRQLIHKFFPGSRSGHRRIRKLIELRLLRRDKWKWLAPSVLRVTAEGARLAHTDVGQAKLVVSEIPHSLAVVDLVEELLRSHPDATLTTERELRGQRHRARQERQREVGRGRMPDGLLTFPDGRMVAIELDLTPKRERLYAQHIRAHAAEPWSLCWWVPSEATAARLRRVVTREYATNRVEVFVRPA